jgi:hypothetical protein
MLKFPGRLAFQFATNRLWLTGLLEKIVVNVYRTEVIVQIIMEGHVSDSHTCFSGQLNWGVGCVINYGFVNFEKKPKK